ncbi:MAG: hypothetical protein EA425_11800 [Puniceicoccaceae bacterium]|nr:MAG: hypothetical protein EA425_11800 [Puniceicoccaceae bacterium]
MVPNRLPPSSRDCGITYDNTYNRFGALASGADAAGTRTFAYRADLQLEQENLPAFFNSRVVRPTYATSGVVGRRTGTQFGPSNDPASLYRNTFGHDGATGRINSIDAKTNDTHLTLNYTYRSGSDLLATVSTGSYLRTYNWSNWRNLLTGVDQKWGAPT